jgi:hypothetical protein
MHYNVYDIFYSLHYQHVSAAIAAIFRVMLLQEYKMYKRGLLFRRHSIAIKNSYNFSQNYISNINMG